MKILIVTDAWEPQTNGVVRALKEVSRLLNEQGHDVLVTGPDLSRLTCFPLPSYPSIKLELFAGARLKRLFASFDPDAVHIATEGPLGWTARRIARQRRIPFTTAFHTRFPDYCAARLPRLVKPLARCAVFGLLRAFHKPSRAVLVATQSLENELRERGFGSLYRWPLGVDQNAFQPSAQTEEAFKDLPKPILLSVGRVAVEKNLSAFLTLKTSGTKVVVGDGPDRAAWARAFPDVVFLGAQRGKDLAKLYASADLFVFPSRTDTFGLVLLEAAASGLRIAATPSPGPSDLLDTPEAAGFAVLDADLQKAVDKALDLPVNPTLARTFALKFTWEAAARSFLNAFSVA